MEFDEESDEYALGDQADEVLEGIEQEQAEEAQEAEYTENAWNQAMSRIEEANLFKLLIKGSVFQPGSASPTILNSVNKKIRQFAIRELEILLGIRNPKVEAQPVQVKLPFDEQEIQGLKILAAKLLKRDVSTAIIGDKNPQLATISAAEPVPAAASFTRQEPRLANSSKMQQAPAPTKKPIKKFQKAGRTSVPASSKQDKGFALPTGSIQPKAMPNPNQMVPAGMGASTPGVSLTMDKNMAGQTINSAGLLGKVISQLTGGQLVHQDQTAPGGADGENIDERF